MPLKPINLEQFHAKGMNMHESIVIASRRARQVNEEMKIEFNQRVEMITTSTETDTEDNDINPDQLRISLEFESRPKPTDVALHELVSDEIQWRYKEKEEIPPAVEESEEEEE